MITMNRKENWNDMDELLTAIRDNQKDKPRRNRVQEEASRIHSLRILAGLCVALAFALGCALGVMV